jgi:Mn-dependent DtxR family transcriptional regulator
MTVPSSPLVEIFGPNSSAQLIVYLVFNHGNEFNMADVAERLKVSKAKVNKMKEGLIKYKVIYETRKVGKTSYYRFDRNSKMGKTLYDLVFNLGTADHAMNMAHASATPTLKKDKDDGGGKIIIA